MNSYISLTKTFIKSLSMSKSQDKRRKILIIILSLFAVFGILLPGSLLVGFLLKYMTSSLMEVGLETLGLQLIFYVICIFGIVFGINVILNELYFSNDIEYILPLPLKIRQIVAAKFTSSYISENLMQIAFVIASVIGFGIGSKMGVLNWILAIIGIPFLALLPMVYCAIISMLLMRFTKIIKNKDLVQKITVFIIFIIIVLLLSSATLIQNFDLDTLIMDIQNINTSNLNILNLLFINVPLYVKAINEGSVISFIGYLLVNVVGVIIMLLVAELTYYKGVIGLATSSLSKNKKTIDDLVKSSKEHSQAHAYFLKEVKILRRTPIFYTHCILSNFIWPVFVYAIYKVQGKSLTPLYIRQNYLTDSTMQLFLITFIIGISAFIASLNSISSNAISREGKHFHFMKNIPVDYKIQINVKAWVGILFALLGVMVFFLPTCLILRIPFTHILTYIVLSILSITFVSYMGIYIDSIQPKLVWDDELSVLRENYNMFFSMAIVIFFIGLFSFGGYFLFKGKNLSFITMTLIFLSLIVISNLIVYLISKKSIINNIKEQEEM